MEGSVTHDTPLRAWRCMPCSVRLAAGAERVLRQCPLCAGPLVAEGTAVTPYVAALRVRHDRGEFERVARAWLTQCEGVSQEQVASFQLPQELEPVYLPFRRVHGTVQSHTLVADGSSERQHVRGTYVVEVCMAAGVDEAMVAALEAAVAGQSADACSATVPAGPRLLGEVADDCVAARMDCSLQRLLGHESLGRTAQVLSEQFFLVPVWLHACQWQGRPLRLLMEACSGRLIAEPPPATDGLHRRLEVLGHWGWLPAIFCALLAWLIDVALVRALLAMLALLTLSGGYAIVASLRRALCAGGLREVLLAARERGRVQRVAAWLPGAYAAIAIGAHLAATFVLVSQALALDTHRNEASALAPWAPVDHNLRMSAFAYGRSPDRLLPVAESLSVAASVPVDAKASRLLQVGPGGYPDLPTAVAAAVAGDRIEIAPGRYAGMRLLVDKDLSIHGRGEVTFVWHGGQGPFWRVGGHGTHLALSHLRFEAYGINTAVLGDPNAAYGEPAASVSPQVRLSDVTIDAPASSAIYSTAPGARYVLEGGRFRGGGSAIIMIDGMELSIGPLHGRPTQIASAGTSGVAGNSVGVSVNHTQHLNLDSVSWSGDPGGDVSIRGDMQAAALTASADPGGGQRVLLVDDVGVKTLEVGSSAPSELLRFRVEHGQLQTLAQ